MLPKPASSFAANATRAAGTALLFLFAFGYFWLRVDPALQYQYRMPLFFTGDTFRAEFLARPGGLLEYGTRYLFQWYQPGWPGALIATGILAGIFALARPWFGLARPGSSGLLHHLPLGLLLILGGQYEYPWLETALGLLASLGAAVLYGSLPWGVPWLRLPVFWASSVFLGYAVGILPAVWFVLLAGLLELTVARRRALGAVCLASGLFILALYFRLSHRAPGELLSGWPAGYAGYLTAGLYLCYPVGLVWLAAWASPCAREPAAPVKGKSAGRPQPGLRQRLQNFGESGWVRAALTWIVILAAAGAAWAGVDGNRKALLEVDYRSSREEWRQVLEAVPRIQRFNASSRVNINRALYHRGLLLEAMFCGLQSLEFGLLPGPEQGLEVLRSLSANLLELGQVNLAEHWAHEALEDTGDRPDLLKLLFQINVVKGKPQAARVFLGLLGKNPAFRFWAQERERRLDRDATLADDPGISRLRAVKVATDFPGSHISTPVLLQQLLHSNPINRMAFEYLMAHYLLTLKPEGILKNLNRLDDFHIAGLPRHVEEALLEYRREILAQNRSAPEFNLFGRTIRPETVQRFDRFTRVLANYQGDASAARGSLARDFGDTYWFYRLFEETTARPGGFPRENTP